mmetsp:Transcript_106931/g.297477  ORF Transcript_106931/g.297477 Transcript_106931/m.297477 type:complete len:145 (+) Transcript_106931:95-529(+)
MALRGREARGPQTIQFSADVAGTPTDFVVTDFGSQVFFVVTQSAKIGSLIEATSQESADPMANGDRIYEVRVLFGDRKLQHYRAYARALAEIVATTNSSKSVLLGIALREHSTESFRQVVAAVKERIGPIAEAAEEPEVVPPRP